MACYDWQKLLGEKTVRRNEWLSKTWAKLYFENSCDEYLRNLSTDELMKTKWFEKYGVKSLVLIKNNIKLTKNSILYFEDK